MASSRWEKNMASSRWEKWKCPPDALTVESKLKNLQLTSRQQNEIALAYYMKEMERAETPEERQAWADLLVKKRSNIVKANLQEAMVVDFQLWLQGRSKYNVKQIKETKYNPIDRKYIKVERECTPWGNKDLLHLPDVREWLKLPCLNRDKVAKEIAVLKMTTPLNLEQAWIYYKYIARALVIDGDILKEQRNYNDFDYLEKRPTKPIRNDAGEVVDFEPDDRYTPLSINNPSMPKFDQQAYEKNYRQFDHQFRTGNLGYLFENAEAFNEFSPDDKLVLLLDVAGSIPSFTAKIGAGNDVTVPSDPSQGLGMQVGPSQTYATSALFDAMNNLMKTNQQQQQDEQKKNDHYRAQNNKTQQQMMQAIAELTAVTKTLANAPGTTVVTDLVKELGNEIATTLVNTSGAVYAQNQDVIGRSYDAYRSIQEISDTIKTMVQRQEELIQQQPPPPNVYNITNVMSPANTLPPENTQAEEQQAANVVKIVEEEKAPVQVQQEAPIEVPPTPVVVRAEVEDPLTKPFQIDGSSITNDLLLNGNQELVRLLQLHDRSGEKLMLFKGFIAQLLNAEFKTLGAEGLKEALKNTTFQDMLRQKSQDFARRITHGSFSKSLAFDANPVDPQLRYNFLLQAYHLNDLKNNGEFFRHATTIFAGMASLPANQRDQTENGIRISDSIEKLTKIMPAIARIHDLTQKDGMNDELQRSLDSAFRYLLDDIVEPHLEPQIRMYDKIYRHGVGDLLSYMETMRENAEKAKHDELVPYINELIDRETKRAAAFEVLENEKALLNKKVEEQAKNMLAYEAKMKELMETEARIAEEEKKDLEHEYTGKLNEKENALLQMQSQMDQYHKRIQQLQEQTTADAETIQRNEQVVKQLEQQINDLNVQRGNIENDKLNDHNNLVGQIDRMRAQTEEYQRQITQLNNDKQAIINHKTLTEQTFNNNKADLENKLNIALAQLQEKEQILQNAQKYDWVANNQALEKQRKEHEKLIQEQTNQIQQNMQQIKQFEASLADKNRIEREFQETRTALDEQRRLYTASETKVREYETKIAGLNEQVKGLNDIKQRSDQAIDILDKRAEDRLQMQKLLQGQLNDQQQQMNTYMEKVNELQKKLDSMPPLGEYERLRNEARGHQAEINKLKNINTLLERQKNEAISAAQYNQGAQKTAALDRVQWQKAIEEKTALQKEVEQLNQQIVNMKADIEKTRGGYDQKIKGFDEQLKQKRSEGNESRARLNQLEKQLTAARLETQRINELADKTLKMTRTLQEKGLMDISREMYTHFDNPDSRNRTKAELAIIETSKAIFELQSAIKQDKSLIKKLADEKKKLNQQTKELAEGYQRSVKEFEKNYAEKIEDTNRKLSQYTEAFKQFQIALPTLGETDNIDIYKHAKERNAFIQNQVSFAIEAGKAGVKALNSPEAKELFETNKKQFRVITNNLAADKGRLAVELATIEEARDKISAMEPTTQRDKEVVDEVYSSLVRQEGRVKTKLMQLTDIEVDIGKAYIQIDNLAKDKLSRREKLSEVAKASIEYIGNGYNAVIASGQSLVNSINETMKDGGIYGHSADYLKQLTTTIGIVGMEIGKQARNYRDPISLKLYEDMKRTHETIQAILNMPEAERMRIALSKENERNAPEEIDENEEREGEYMEEEFFNYEGQEGYQKHLRDIFKNMGEVELKGKAALKQSTIQGIQEYISSHGTKGEYSKQLAEFYNRHIGVGEEYQDILIEFLKDPLAVSATVYGHKEANKTKRAQAEELRLQINDMQAAQKKVEEILQRAAPDEEAGNTIINELRRNHPEVLRAIHNQIAFNSIVRSEEQDKDIEKLQNIYVARINFSRKIEETGKMLNLITQAINANNGAVDEYTSENMDEVLRDVDNALGVNSKYEAGEDKLSSAMGYIINHGIIENEAKLELSEDKKEMYGLDHETITTLGKTLGTENSRFVVGVLNATYVDKQFNPMEFMGAFQMSQRKLRSAITDKARAVAESLKVSIMDYADDPDVRRESSRFNENAKTYQDLVSSLVASGYGEGSDFKRMESGRPKSNEAFYRVMTSAIYDYMKALNQIDKWKDKVKIKREQEQMMKNRGKAIGDVLLSTLKQKTKNAKELFAQARLEEQAAGRNEVRIEDLNRLRANKMR